MPFSLTRQIASASRRGFLQGVGVSLALPWLPSLRCHGAVGDQPERPPVRAAFLYFPNGVWEEAWNPSQEGRDYQLPFSLEPLAEVKADVLVLTGLDKKNSRQGDGHYAKTANFLTGMPVVKTTGKDISSGGISVDQLAAQHVGQFTPLPALELGTEPVISGIDSNVGYTRLYGSHISWQSANRPVAKEINPRLVYQRLFGQGLVSRWRTAESYQNLLDYVLEDARRVRTRLGRDDQFKMDEYLDAVRAVEKRIEYYSRSGQRPLEPQPDRPDAERPTGMPEDFREHIEVMMDLIVLAFRTDSTRLCTFMFANDVSGRNFSFLDGVRGGHHEMSHHENKEEKIDQYKRINRWHVQQLVRMLQKMKAITEGDGTLLDNAMILFGSSLSDGNRHDPDNLPILLAGRGGGTIDSGRHIAMQGEVPLCNLYVSMLNKIGVPAREFGDSTGPLSAIDAT